VFAFMLLPFVIWAAARFGVEGVALSSVVVATIATVDTALGLGPFAQNSVFINALLLDVFFTVLTVSGLSLAAVIAERERAENEHDRLIREQAALEERLRAAAALREAEEKTAVLRDELAHLNRVGMLSALSGALAHEINQPLTAVGVNVETARLLLAAEKPSLDALSATLADIRSDNMRAGQVLQQVRTLLKKAAAHYESVALDATVEEVVKLIQSSAIRRGIVVDVDLARGERPIIGDRVQVQQVVLNLLMNACDAVENNERTLRRVSIRTVARGKAMAVEVRDRGEGLSDDELARVFEPFYTTKPDGLGLGLSICRAIVNAHGGTLDAVRNEDGGMTFSASFPFWEAATEIPRGTGSKQASLHR
jgi:C4-dicarboxylate-specific signal transduction histidine kinase